MNNQELFQKSLQLVPGGVHSPVRSFKGLHTTPLFIKSANGAKFVDEEDHEFIDFCMSFGPMILGHRNVEVEQAIIHAVQRGWSYGACEKYSLELAEYIIDKISFIEQIRFVNSGTEAVMTALRIARGYTGKNKVIKFSGCYHGHLDSMLIKAGSGLAGTASASSAGVTEETAKDTLICSLGDLRQLELIISEHKEDIAAIIIEPLPANNGLLIQNQSFLKSLRELCTQHKILLIFDEVISGFRVGFGGMSQHSKINPDIVTYGKIIGGGMPVGAIAGKKEIMEMLAPIGPVYQAGTLSANPVAMSAGLATLKQLTPETYQTLEKNTNRICEIFQEWIGSVNEFENVKIHQYSSLFWIEAGQQFANLFEVLLKKGIYLAPNGVEVGFVSAAHNDKIIDELKHKLWN
jgi:glutamate-1-semialdehyde 2,1-aminomutase